MKGRFRDLVRSDLCSVRCLKQAAKYTVDITAVGKRRVLRKFNSRRHFRSAILHATNPFN